MTMSQIKITTVFLIAIIVLPCINCEPRWYFSKNEPQRDSEIKNISPNDNITIIDDDSSNNASFYINSDLLNVRDNDNVTDSEGRSAKMFKLEDLLAADDGDDSSSYQGQRESRIINDEKSPNLSIKGFIPIVGLSADKDDNKPKIKPNKPEEQAESYAPYSHLLHSYSQGVPYNNNPQAGLQQHVAKPEDQRFIGAALQGIAASLAGRPTRKYGTGGEHYSPSNNLGFDANHDGCVCVPFYMCKNGFLDQGAKSSSSSKINLETAQSIINQFAVKAPTRYDVGPQYNHQQKNFHHNQQKHIQPDYLPIDERSNGDLVLSGSQVINEVS